MSIRKEYETACERLQQDYFSGKIKTEREWDEKVEELQKKLGIKKASVYRYKHDNGSRIYKTVLIFPDE